MGERATERGRPNGGGNRVNGQADERTGEQVNQRTGERVNE